MTKIGELFEKDINRHIEEVIKVEQAAEEVVKQEIQEYVVTEALKEHFCTVYDAVAEYASNPHEGIGIWLSGFFGSGKSSFAKILGYTLANRQLGEKTASQWFMETAKDDRVANYLKNINSRIPFHAVIFDVSMDRGVTSGDKLTELMYKALLRSLDYADDLDLAELEITLEEKSLLGDFVSRFQSTFDENWEEERELAFGISKASHILHLMMPETCPSPDSWANSISKGGIGDFVGRADISPNKLAERAFELARRRKPGHGLIFVIDEVGQYISRSVDRMLDLQGIIQSVGMESRNQVSAGKAPAPCWIVVTSQEKLDEVVDALGDKQVELARLQDRFRIAIDLKPSDIEEVAAKRVLSKTEEAKRLLGSLYDENEGRLKTYSTMEGTKRDMSLSKEEFINLYPYLPYQVDLSIDIVDGLRTKRAGHGHVGGSNRTIIKQAQQMLVHDRVKLADAEIGRLVTLDKVYELLYAGNLLPSEVTKEIDVIPERLKGDELALKVAKAIALMETVKDLTRTKTNIAAALYPDITSEAVEKDVERALETLQEAQIIRSSEQGYKLLTLQEKNWETERNKKYPKPRERNLLKEETIRAVIGETGIRTFKYGNQKSFKTGLIINGNKLEEGQIAIWVECVNAEDFSDAESQIRSRSREGEGASTVFWVFKLTEEADRLLIELYRSNAMISVYDQLRAQRNISNEEKACLEDEKTRKDDFERKLKAELERAMLEGAGYFQGVRTDAASLDGSLKVMLRKLLENAVPILYPKLGIYAKAVKGDEAQKLLTAANLGGLPGVFYDTEDGLKLVVKEEDKHVINTSCEAAREILDYLTRENDYGNKVTGKTLEAHFSDMPYGADVDVLRTVLSALFRAGSIEVTSQGRKYRDYKEAASHQSFVNNMAFRAATFAPRKGIDIKELSKAAEAYERLTGEEVDVEEMSITRAMRALALREHGSATSALAQMQAFSLPGRDLVEEFAQDLQEYISCESTECVAKLASEGNTLREQWDRFQTIRRALEKGAVDRIARARTALNEMYPALQASSLDEGTAEAAEDIKAMLEGDDVYNQLELLEGKAELIAERFAELYGELHERRNHRYKSAIDELKAESVWGELDTSDQESILAPLQSRICEAFELNERSTACRNCHAGFSQMQSDMLAVEQLLTQARASLHDIVHPDKVEQVRVSRLFSGLIESEEDVEAVLEELGKAIRKLLAEGKKVELA